MSATERISDRYAQLLELREEALARYHTKFTGDFSRVPYRILLPLLSLRAARRGAPGMPVGPFLLSGIAPAFRIALRRLQRRRSKRPPSRAPLRVLDIGCAGGILLKYLRSWTTWPIEYTGVEVAPPAERPDFRMVSSLSELDDEKFDLIMMSEVAEHMTADDFLANYVGECRRLLRADGLFVVGVPNPLVPTYLQQDITHVQHYPWYDLYAILRFHFDAVTPCRTCYVTSLKKLVLLPLKRAISSALDVDWCEGLTMVATIGNGS